MEAAPLNVFTAGFMGALFGGGITLLSLWTTLRHDVEKELRGRRIQAAGEAMSAIGRLTTELQGRGFLHPKAIDAYADVISAVTILKVFVGESRQHFFGEVLDTALRGLTIVARSIAQQDPRNDEGREMHRVPLLISAHALQLTIGRWVAYPKEFRPRVGWRRRKQDVLDVVNRQTQAVQQHAADEADTVVSSSFE